MGLYHPNPRVEQLVRARRLTADGAETIEGAVRFCVGVDGKTKDLATAAPTGEAKLDEVLRATVGAWRFKPAQRGSQPVEACSTAIFAMSFE